MLRTAIHIVRSDKNTLVLMLQLMIFYLLFDQSISALSTTASTTAGQI